MPIRTVVSPLLGAACHVVADDAGRCVVVDPGWGVTAAVAKVVAAEGWRPVAVLLTHGHVDHTWSAGGVADALGVAVHVHAEDAYRLADPVGSLGPLGAQLAAMVPEVAPPAPPSRVATFTCPGGAAVLDLGGAAVTALHLPGHTQGSTTYVVHDADGPIACTGDVLFAGTIGRTDLPGGDDAAMARSLRALVAHGAALGPGTRVLPGHGPATTVGAETATNPWLRAGT